VIRVLPARLHMYLMNNQAIHMRRLMLNSPNQLGQRITEAMKTSRFWIERKKSNGLKVIEIVEPVSKSIVPSQAETVAILNGWRGGQVIGSEHTVQEMTAATGVSLTTCGTRVEYWSAEGKAKLVSGFVEGKQLTGETRFRIVEPQPVQSVKPQPTVRPVYGDAGPVRVEGQHQGSTAGSIVDPVSNS